MEADRDCDLLRLFVLLFEADLLMLIEAETDLGPDMAAECVVEIESERLLVILRDRDLD